MAVRLPRPGEPVRGSTTGRPLMAAMDLLGRRWALRILWELRGKPLGARALQSRCDRMSSSVLYERLDELTAAGLLARNEAGAYLLTDLGAALAPALESLDAWARRWSETLRE
jgi:DNA-binding HxlR family transcriptional regulator